MNLQPHANRRIRMKRWVLLDVYGQIWDNRMEESASGIYREYGSKSMALKDGLHAKEITVYFTLKPL